MTKEQEEQALRVLRDLDISEVMSLLLRGGNRYNKRILKFFRWFCKYAPIFIMTYHSYGVFMFSQHPREMFVAISENMACYSFIYFMVYILPMIMILASRFFWLCWKYRIPFFYFFGVNSIHIAYGSLFTTNNMVMAHYCLSLMILLFYLYGAFDWVVNNTKLGRRFFFLIYLLYYGQSTKGIQLQNDV